MIDVYNQRGGKMDVPESTLRTVRVKCTCKADLYDEQRFKVTCRRKRFCKVKIFKRFAFAFFIKLCRLGRLF